MKKIILIFLLLTVFAAALFADANFTSKPGLKSQGAGFCLALDTDRVVLGESIEDFISPRFLVQRQVSFSRSQGRHSQEVFNIWSSYFLGNVLGASSHNNVELLGHALPFR